MYRLFLHLALVFGVLALSTSAIFVRLADAPSGVTAFYRLFFALLVLLPVVLGRTSGRQELRSLTRRQWTVSLAAGLLLAIHYIMWFESLRYTSVASSTVLVSLQPIFSILLGRIFFTERLSRLAALGCVVALAGSVIIGYGDFRTGWLAFVGDVIALASAALISLYFFLGQTVRQRVSAATYSALGYAGSTVFLALYVLVRGERFSGYPVRTWGCFLGLALVATILGQLTFNLLLRWLPATTISMSILGEPVGTCILAFLILGEGIAPRQSVGILVLLAGLLLYFFAGKIGEKAGETADLSPKE